MTLKIEANTSDSVAHDIG